MEVRPKRKYTELWASKMRAVFRLLDKKQLGIYIYLTFIRTIIVASVSIAMGRNAFVEGRLGGW